MKNWMHEILGFYDLQSLNRMSAGQVALWHALMYINNKCGWIEWFSVTNQTLELYTGLTRQSIVKARSKLIQKGYLEIKLNGTNATSYKLISMQKNDCVSSNSTQDSTQVSTQDSTQDDTLTSNSLQDGLQVGLQDGLQVGLQDGLQDTPLTSNSLQDGLQVGLQDGCTLNKHKHKDKHKDSNTKATKTTKKFIPPTLEEVKAYCDERSSSVDPVKFFEYFDVSGWADKNGKPVISWKQKLITWESYNTGGSRNECYGNIKNSNTKQSSNSDGDYDFYANIKQQIY